MDDVGVGGASYLEITILFDLSAGERLELETAVLQISKSGTEIGRK